MNTHSLLFSILFLISIAQGFAACVLDTAFAATSGINNGEVNAVAVQSDGKVVVGGSFTNPDGETYNLCRFNADGTFDWSFSPPEVTGVISALAIHRINNEDRILVGGYFAISGSMQMFTRLLPNGAVDTGFANGQTAGFDYWVYAIAVAADNKIIVGGEFIYWGGYSGQTAVYRLARMNSDGSLDTSFRNSSGGSSVIINGTVRSVAVRGSDGKVAIGGDFTYPRQRIALMNATDGLPDWSFNPGTLFPHSVKAVAFTSGYIDNQGVFIHRILAGTTADPGPGRALYRLLPSGALDSFNHPSMNSGNIRALHVDSAQNIYVGGDFTVATMKGFFRMNQGPTGQDIDYAWGTSCTPAGINSGVVNAVALGGTTPRVAIGGTFTQVEGVSRGRVARLVP